MSSSVWKVIVHMECPAPVEFSFLKAEEAQAFKQVLKHHMIQGSVLDHALGGPGDKSVLIRGANIQHVLIKQVS